MSNKAKEHIKKDAVKGLIIDILWIVSLAIFNHMGHIEITLFEGVVAFVLFYIAFVSLCALFDLTFYRD